MKTVVFIVLILFSSFAFAVTLNVPGEYPDIQSAISAAQDGDTVLVAPGEYGGPIGFQGKNIVVKSTDGPSETLIRTFSDFHCVIFTGGEDSTAIIEGFTIRNRISDSEFLDTNSKDIVEKGGGIYIYESSPTVQNNIIEDCFAGSGGGVYIQNSSGFLTDNIIRNNQTSGGSNRGGGIVVAGSESNGPSSIIGCEITDNNAQYGGGIFLSHTCTEIINNEIRDNFADQEGGGISIWGMESDVYFYSNYIKGNITYHEGGGICINRGEATLIGNLIVENEGDIGGGVYESSTGIIHIENNTIAMNTAATGGGGIISTRDSLYLGNAIFWGNTGGMGSQISLPATTNLSSTHISYCDIQYGQDSIYLGPIATLYWGPGNIDVDPQFETGPLGDYHISYGSPCIDTGNPDSEYNDPEDPFNPGYALWPAMGLIRNDMGAFGGSGTGYWLSVEEEESAALPEAELRLRSFPNPFRTSCTVCYELPEFSHVVLQVYDLSGRLVNTLVDEDLSAGMYSAHMDGSDLYPGVYFIRLIAGELSESRRCIIVR